MPLATSSRMAALRAVKLPGCKSNATGSSSAFRGGTTRSNSNLAAPTSPAVAWQISCSKIAGTRSPIAARSCAICPFPEGRPAGLPLVPGSHRPRFFLLTCLPPALSGLDRSVSPMVNIMDVVITHTNKLIRVGALQEWERVGGAVERANPTQG